MHNHAHIWGWKALITAVADGRWRRSASPRNSRLRALAGPAAPLLRVSQALSLLRAGGLPRPLGSPAHPSAARAPTLRLGLQQPLRLRFPAPARRALEEPAALRRIVPLGLTPSLCLDSSAALALVATSSLGPLPLSRKVGVLSSADAHHFFSSFSFRS